MNDGPNDDPKAVRVRFWGTRGSIPSPGPETVVHGGNTSCVELLYEGRRWILDGGTGIRRLGTSMMEPGENRDATIILSHYHWDHVQGLPFFSPLYASDARISIMGPREGERGVAQMMEGLMGPPHFPVPCDLVQSDLHMVDIVESSFQVLGERIDTYPCRHSSQTLAIRLTLGGHRICYAPDNELRGGDFPVDSADTDWRLGLEAFVKDADLLIHDAMFTDDEYPRVEGWGHSTFRQATELAQAAGVKRLAYCHHAPDRSDSALVAIVAEQRKILADEDSDLRVWAAREGEVGWL